MCIIFLFHSFSSFEFPLWAEFVHAHAIFIESCSNSKLAPQPCLRIMDSLQHSYPNCPCRLRQFNFWFNFGQFFLLEDVYFYFDYN